MMLLRPILNKIFIDNLCLYGKKMAYILNEGIIRIYVMTKIKKKSLIVVPVYGFKKYWYSNMTFYIVV
jgi:hypothetical protein